MATAYPDKNVFGARIEDPDITGFYGKNYIKSKDAPWLIIDVVVDKNSPVMPAMLDSMERDFKLYGDDPSDLARYLRELERDPYVEKVTITQRTR